MNIHFTDAQFFEQLKESTLAKVRVGSHLYGTNNENSDEDFLYIYPTSNNELLSAIKTHHQLQYKENNIDHNFVSLHSFIQNTINGDSPINFEVIQSSELNGTSLTFLTGLKAFFITYTVIRSYNGFVKRDIKHYSKAQTEYEKLKRLGHILRGIMYVDALLEDNFLFSDINQKFISASQTLSTDKRTVNDLLKKFQETAETQRKRLNEMLDSGTLGYAKNMDISAATRLNKQLIELSQQPEYIRKQNILQHFDMSYFVNSFENWVIYDK